MTTKTCFCSFCEQNLPITEFYTTKRITEYPSGHLPLCKTCITFGIDNCNPQTFLPILEAVNVPYIKYDWDKLCERHPDKINLPLGIIGRYLSKMKLKSFQGYEFKDSEFLNKRGEENA